MANQELFPLIQAKLNIGENVQSVSFFLLKLFMKAYHIWFQKYKLFF